MAQVPLNYGLSAEDGTGDPLRTIFAKIQGNLSDLDGRLTTTTALTGTLGSAAFRNVGITAGSVADGGALTAETSRAMAAEQTNATAIQANTTLINNETSRAQGVELLKAPIASPALTGVPTAPTASNGTNSNQIATTAFVLNNAGSGGGGGGGGGVPPTRQILTSGLLTGGGDLTTDRTITLPAAAQSDVATGTDQTKALTSFSVAAALGAKAALASPALVGTPTAPTAAAGNNGAQIATTAFVTGALGSYAPLASPTFSGTPAVPTAPAGTNTTQAASTAFVTALVGASSQGLTGNGYKRLPGGLTIQWGVNTPANGDQGISFPVAFSATPYSVVATAGSNSGQAAAAYVAETDGFTSSSFALHVRFVGNGGTVNAAAIASSWIAIGPT